MRGSSRPRRPLPPRGRGAGFTLIEMIIVLVIFSIIVVAMTPMLKSFVDALIYGRTIMLADSQASFVMARIGKELRDAENLYTLGVTPVSDFTFDTKNLGMTVRYHLNSDRLMRSEDGGASQPMAEGISSFQVSTANGRLVKVELGFASAGYSVRTAV
ncbi:MAG: prepilin-type N-terminal cleavage/methylation domain-containing protein, partial [Magnetococcales bacterium]|nr:prepilin-type N-terminal cleavage/methylation domain-containing protein [Magnetococcales bacterium]